MSVEHNMEETLGKLLKFLTDIKTPSAVDVDLNYFADGLINVRSIVYIQLQKLNNMLFYLGEAHAANVDIILDHVQSGRGEE